MPNIPARLADPAYLAATATIIGSAVPTGKRFLIQSAQATNSNGGATKTIDIHIVPSGGSATVANKVISAKSIDATLGKRLYEIEGQVLHAGDGLYGLCSSASSVLITISGRYLSGDGIT